MAGWRQACHQPPIVNNAVFLHSRWPHCNPLVRSEIIPSSFWNPSLTTGPHSKSTFSLSDLQHFLSIQTVWNGATEHKEADVRHWYWVLCYCYWLFLWHMTLFFFNLYFYVFVPLFTSTVWIIKGVHLLLCIVFTFKAIQKKLCFAKKKEVPFSHCCQFNTQLTLGKTWNWFWNKVGSSRGCCTVLTTLATATIEMTHRW